MRDRVFTFSFSSSGLANHDPHARGHDPQLEWDPALELAALDRGEGVQDRQCGSSEGDVQMLGDADGQLLARGLHAQPPEEDEIADEASGGEFVN